jgi:hypothetical protein
MPSDFHGRLGNWHCSAIRPLLPKLICSGRLDPLGHWRRLADKPDKEIAKYWRNKRERSHSPLVPAP